MISWVKDKLQPSRAQAAPFGGHLVADLDQMVTDPVAFRWGGKIHYIKPISTEHFLRASEGITRVEILKRKEKVTAEEVIEAYAYLVEGVCDSIAKKDLYKMTSPQIAGLYQLINDCVAGKAYGEKKSPESKPE